MPQNGSGLGNAYAGAAATSEDAGAMFFNPAALGFLSRPQMSLGVARFDSHTMFSDQGSVEPGPGPFTRVLNGNGGNAGTVEYVPNAYASMPVTRQLAVGLGVSAPYGLSTEYAPGWRGQFLAQGSKLSTVDVNAAFAFRVTDQVSLGAGVSRQRVDSELTQAVNGFIFGPPDFGFKVKGHGLAWGYNAGVLYQPTPRLRLGVAYRSSVDHTIEGNYAFDPGTPAVLAAGAGLPALSGPARVRLKLPNTFTMATAWKPQDRWELLFDATRTGWSSVQEQRIQFPNGGADQSTAFNWHSTWRVSAGVNHSLNDNWMLRFGVALDRSPIPDDTRSPRLPGADALILAIGARVRISKSMAVNAGYNHVRAHAARVNYNGGNPAANGTLVGTYKGRLNIVGGSLTIEF